MSPEHHHDMWTAAVYTHTSCLWSQFGGGLTRFAVGTHRRHHDRVSVCAAAFLLPSAASLGRSMLPAMHHPIRKAEIGGSLSGAIEDQQLVLDEHRFGDDGTRAARPSESGDCRHQMQKEDGQIAHRTILASSRNR